MKKIILSVCLLLFLSSTTVHAETLTELQNNLQTQTDELKELNDKIEEKTEDILLCEANLKSVNTNLDSQYEDMKLRIQYMYQNGNSSYLESFLKHKSITSLLQDITYKTEIVKYDREKLEEMKNTADEIKEKKKELKKEKENLEKLQKESEEKKTELEKLIEEKKNELNEESLKNATVALNGGNTITYTTANDYGYSDQQLDLICAIVAQESSANYDGALAVITCAMNRCDSPRWQYLGRDPLSQLCANGQFCYSIDGYHKKRLNGNYADFVRQAVLDCLNGKRNHNFLSFRGYPGNGSNTCIGGNWYFNAM